MLAEAEAPQANVVSAAGEDVWLGSTDGLLRLDAETLRRKAVFRELSPQLAGDVLATDSDVWVRLKGEQFALPPRPRDQRGDRVRQGGTHNLSSGSVLATEGADLDHGLRQQPVVPPQPLTPGPLKPVRE